MQILTYLPYDRNANYSLIFIIVLSPFQALLAAGGVCFSCRIIERIRETSLLVLLDFGLKSQSLAIRSHSVSGSISSVSATNCFSAFLKN